MLTPRELERYADVLLWGLQKARRNRFRKKDIIAVRFNLSAAPLAESLHARLLGQGFHPVMQCQPTPGMESSFYRLCNAEQLKFIAPGEAELARHLNGSILLHAPEALTHLAGVDPRKIGRTAIARKPLRNILDQREADGTYGWTLCLYPTAALAEQAGMDMQRYCRQVAKACLLNRKNPTEEWERIFRNAQGLKKRLNRLKVRFFHIESDHIDMRIRLGPKRKWVGITGRNIPSFELYVSPDCRGGEGVFFADQPSFRNGNLVRGVRLEFKNGRVVAVTAEGGEKFVESQLAMDPGARRLGEFSLTDKNLSKIDRFMANTLYDENFGGRHGNCHIALGASYANSYAGKRETLSPALKKKLGFNDSALHWDFVNTEKKRVTAHLHGGGSVIIYEGGRFRL